MRKKKTVDKGVFIVLLLLIFVGAIILVMRFLLANNCPDADFTMSNKSPRINELVTFNFTNPEAKTWQWDFGDNSSFGSHSVESHIYLMPGKYTVRLRTNGSADCDKVAFIDVKTKEIVIETKVEKVLPMPEIEGTKITYVGIPVKFKEISGTATSWEWFFSETGRVDSKEQNPTYTFREPGLKKVTLIINGDSEIAQFEVKVNPKQIIYVPPPPSKDKKNTEPVTQKAPQINDEKFKSMLKKIADREISSEEFDKYINGYFSMSIKVNNKVIEFDSYLKRLGITGEFSIKSLKLKKDKYGYVNDIEITE